MAKKTKLEFTKRQLQAVINIIETIEGMYGCADDIHGLGNWDTEMQKEIRNIDRMLKSNGLIRNK